MRTRITKNQTKALLDLGADIPLERVTPYMEILRTHAYSMGNHSGRKVIDPDGTRTASPEGIMYKIYMNLSIGDLMNRLPPFIPYGDPLLFEGAYTFDIKFKDGKWVATYNDGDKILFESGKCDRMIDALFESYCFILQYAKNHNISDIKIPEIDDDDELDDDYLFTGRV